MQILRDRRAITAREMGTLQSADDGTGAAGGARPIVGGLQRAHLTSRDRTAVTEDLHRSIGESKGRGILVSPACVIRHPVDEAMLKWTAETVRSYRSS